MSKKQRVVKCDKCGCEKIIGSRAMGTIDDREFYGNHNCKDGKMGTFFKVGEIDDLIEDEVTGIAVKADNRPEDKWEHRSEMMLCKTCMWYVPKKNRGGNAIGRCRKHAPTMGGYPVVFEVDWCGDHKLDENN